VHAAPDRSNVVGAALDGGVSGLAGAYAAGLDPVAVVDEVLARIAAADDPAIWIDVEPAASLRAAAAELRDRRPRGLPLWGVPFGVKDNIDVAGRVTTAALPGAAYRADEDALVVQRLLDAGALYVGKTNLDQLATGLVGTRSPYGVPRNPIDPGLVPGGSSSGSAVAVARRQVPFALGTDTAGSGRVPAALCGVVGAKREPGATPTQGVVPASPSLDCVSTFATAVADALAVDGVVAGRPWPVASGPFTVAVSDAGLAESGALAQTGHATTAVDLAPFHEAGDLLYAGAWLSERTGAIGDIISGRPEGLDDTVRRVVDGGTWYSGVEAFGALRTRRAIAAGLAPFWARFDVLVVPTVEHVPTLDEVAADPIGVNVALGRNTTFANLLGLAAIAVPGRTGAGDRPGIGGVTVLGPPAHAGAVAAVAADLAAEAITPGHGASGGTTLVAVVGAHLRGEPLNGELTGRGGHLVATTTTAPRYRLHLLAGGPPLRPGLERVDQGGAAIEVEVWSLDAAGLGALTAGVPAPLGIGSVELADGRWVKGFICEPHGLRTATDITRHGGWRAFVSSRR
jgi:allophanate hydrolase